MSGGVFAVSRGIFNHEIFADEPFSEREAFIWLVGEAAWKPRRVRVGRALIDLERGQCAYSMRFMAQKWKWSEARVRRFINKLKNDAMIDVLSDALATRITICNYDKYQKVGTPNDALDDAPTDELATDSRRKERNRGNNRKKVNSALPTYTPEFERFRSAYPKRDGSQDWSKAFESFEKHRKDGVDVEDMIRGAGLYAADCKRTGKAGTEYTKQAVSFLRGRHWPEWLEKGDTLPIERPAGYPPNIPPPDRAREIFLRGLWQESTWGPPPGQPGCKVPEHIQSEWLSSRPTLTPKEDAA